MSTHQLIADYLSGHDLRFLRDQDDDYVLVFGLADHASVFVNIIVVSERLVQVDATSIANVAVDACVALYPILNRYHSIHRFPTAHLAFADDEPLATLHTNQNLFIGEQDPAVSLTLQLSVAFSAIVDLFGFVRDAYPTYDTPVTATELGTVA